MMKKITSILSLVMISLLALAQPPKGMGKSDPEAKKILDAVSAKFKTFKNGIQSNFSLKVENGAGKSLASKSGKVFMKGTKYRVSITGQDIFCDGSNVWTYDKNANEVIISKIDPNANTITPQKILTNFYDKDFLYRLTADTKTTQEIELTPIDKSKPFHKVAVTVNKATQTISSTKVFEKTGNKYTYSVSGMNTTSALADAQFVFDAKKYPGVEVVDNR
jgi:outer membrane lipoprotein carrier protein